MKKILQIILVSFCATLSSCMREDTSILQTENFNNVLLYTFHAYNGEKEDTKTTLTNGGRDILWGAKDSINVFMGASASSRFISDNQSPNNSADFSGAFKAINSTGSPVFWAISPYHKANTCDGESVKVVVPGIQRVSPEDYDSRSFISIARSEDNNLFFYNVCGGISFKIKRRDIESITIRGNNDEVLAGGVRVSFDKDGKPVIIDEFMPVKEIIVVPEGKAFTVDAYYYASIRPQYLSSGFTVIFTSSVTNEQVEKVYPSPVTIKRSVWGQLSNIDKDIDFEYVDLGLNVFWSYKNFRANSFNEDGKYVKGGTAKVDSLYSPWLRPTKDQFQELIKNCHFEETQVDGQSLLKVVSDVPGYEEKSLYFPYSGYQRTDGTFTNVGTACRINTSTSSGYNGLYKAFEYIKGGSEGAQIKDLNPDFKTPVRPVVKQKGYSDYDYPDELRMYSTDTLNLREYNKRVNDDWKGFPFSISPFSPDASYYVSDPSLAEVQKYNTGIPYIVPKQKTGTFQIRVVNKYGFADVKDVTIIDKLIELEKLYFSMNPHARIQITGVYYPKKGVIEDYNWRVSAGLNPDKSRDDYYLDHIIARFWVSSNTYHETVINDIDGTSYTLDFNLYDSHSLRIEPSFADTELVWESFTMSGKPSNVVNSEGLATFTYSGVSSDYWGGFGWKNPTLSNTTQEELFKYDLVVTSDNGLTAYSELWFGLYMHKEPNDNPRK